VFRNANGAYAASYVFYCLIMHFNSTNKGSYLYIYKWNERPHFWAVTSI